MGGTFRIWAINQWGKNLVRNLQYSPRTWLVRGLYLAISTSKIGKLWNFRVLSIMPKIPELSVGIQMERSILVSSDRNTWVHLGGGALTCISIGIF